MAIILPFPSAPSRTQRRHLHPRCPSQTLIRARAPRPSAPPPPPPPSRRRHGRCLLLLDTAGVATSRAPRSSGSRPGSSRRRSPVAPSTPLLALTSAPARRRGGEGWVCREASRFRRAAAVASCRLLNARAFASGCGGKMAKLVLVPVAASTDPIEAADTTDVLNLSGVRVTIATKPSTGSSSSPTAASPTWRARPSTSSPCRLAGDLLYMMEKVHCRGDPWNAVPSQGPATAIEFAW